MAKGNEVEVVTVSRGTVATQSALNPMAVLVKVVVGEVEVMCPRWVTELPWEVGTEDIAERIVMGILTAESWEDALTPAEAEGVRDHLDELIVIHGFVMAPSDQDGGLGAYAKLDVTFPPDDKHKMLTCGGSNVIAQLAKVHAAEAFPVAVRPFETEAKSNKNHKPLYLVLDRGNTQTVKAGEEAF